MILYPNIPLTKEEYAEQMMLLIEQHIKEEEKREKFIVDTMAIIVIVACLTIILNDLGVFKFMLKILKKIRYVLILVAITFMLGLAFTAGKQTIYILRDKFYPTNRANFKINW